MPSIAENTQYKIELPGTMQTNFGLRSVTSYQLSGNDASQFTVVTENNKFYLVLAPKDFENPTDLGLNNTYDVVYRSFYDSPLGSFFDAFGPESLVSVTITDVNEAPTAIVTSAIANITENVAIAPNKVVTTFSITDDAIGNNVVSLTGADAGLFKIVGNTVQWAVPVTPDFEAKTKFDFNLVVKDAQLNSTLTKALSIAVVNVQEGNEPPVTPPLDPNAPFDGTVPALVVTNFVNGTVPTSAAKSPSRKG